MLDLGPRQQPLRHPGALHAGKGMQLAGRNPGRDCAAG